MIIEYDKEEWKVIEDFPCYMISNMGRVKNINTGNMLKGTKDGLGYVKHTLRTYDENGKRVSTKNKFTHRLVAQYFVYNPSPEKYDVVNHIDENKSNPIYNNLEWTDAKGNANHGTRNKRIGVNGGRPVCEYDIDGNYIRTWKSAVYVSEIYPISERTIHDPCRLHRGLAYGHQWRYFDETHGEPIGKVNKSSLNMLKSKCITYNYDFDIPEEYLYKSETKIDEQINMLKEILLDVTLTEETRNKIVKAIECLVS